MASVLIVFGSTTGNTETAADILTSHLQSAGHAVSSKNVTDVEKDDFTSPDLVFFGCSTWGDEEIELQDDFDEFFTGMMEEIPFAGKKVAAFGCGDTSYTWFCGAVDAIEEKAKTLGATVVVEGLKIDGDPDDARDDIQSWGAEAVGA